MDKDPGKMGEILVDKALFLQLNGIYTPLSRRASRLCQDLADAGYAARWDWYGLHAALIDGGYQTEQFPIPVVVVDGLCDVGFDLDRIFLGFQLSRAAALAFDYRQLPDHFEVYGTEDYLHDLYHLGMDLDGIPRRIEHSSERAVGVQLTFSSDTPDKALLAAVDRCCQQVMTSR